MTTRTRTAAALGALALALALAGCRAGANPTGEDHHDPAPDAESSHDHHDHDHDEISDLDRPLEELFAARCEHDVPTHRCEECRYEVGVVRVPPELVERGLVQTAGVDVRPFRADVELTGEIRFDESRIAHLGPRMSGVVREVGVDLGQPVEAGMGLIEIDSPPLAEAEAAYLETLARHRLAERTLDRQRELRASRISSEREFLEAEQTFEAAGIRANAERQKLLRLGLTESEIEGLEGAGIGGATGRHTLRAPFAGEALTLHAVRGERVEPGDELVLFGDTRTLWVWVDLYEQVLDAVSHARGGGALPARITVGAYPGRVFDGRVDFIGRTMDETTRTVKARVTLENPDGRLRPGMFATVRIAVGAGDEALAVPASAVLADEGRDFVFVHHEDEWFVRRPVQVGRRTDGFVEIVSGLSGSQRVATTGSFLLKSDVLRSKMGEGCAH